MKSKTPSLDETQLCVPLPLINTRIVKACFTYFWNFLHMCSRGNKVLKLIIFINMTVTLLMIDTICIIPRELSKVVKPSVE